jgi:alkanesulfonate monooxygenase
MRTVEPLPSWSGRRVDATGVIGFSDARASNVYRQMLRDLLSPTRKYVDSLSRHYSSAKGIPLKLHWFLPTNGDSRHVVGGGHGVPTGQAGGDRPASVGYLGQIARSAEQLGFEGALTPTGAWCEDAWLTTAMLASVSERLRFLVAFRPGLTSPTLAAQMAATFQNLSGRRLLLNVVTGGEAHEQRAYGDFLDKEARYSRCGEFLHVVRALWRGETVDFRGEHLAVEGARLTSVPEPQPTVYFGGSSAPAGAVAARHADVYLTWGEPPAAVKKKIAGIRDLAAAEGREVRFGIRLHTITRDTADEAWAEADRLLNAVDGDTISAVQRGLGRSESEGQRRMLALHRGRRDDLEVAPNLWAGVGLVRGGAGTALVGSHVDVADRIEEYHRLGIDEFILSGYPHLEAAYWFAEGVMPVLAERGLWTRPDATAAAGSGSAAAARTQVPFGDVREAVS